MKMYSLLDGKYELDGKNAPIKIEGEKALYQTARLILNAKRGRFYPNKDYGSKLFEGLKEPYLEYALALAKQALDALDGVYVEKAYTKDNHLYFSLIINGKECETEVRVE